MLKNSPSMPRRKEPEAIERVARFGERMAMSRAQAAHYVGLSPNTFDKLVGAGHFPRARKYPEIRRLFWIRSELDEALFGMPQGEPVDPWEGVGDL